MGDFMKKIKYFSSGFFSAFLVMALLLSAVSFANSSTLSATISDIKVYLDGNAFISKDSAGNELKPLIINGSTYLPVKAISEAVGKPVTWEPKTRSIYIGKNDLGTPAIYLLQLKSFYRSRDTYYVEKPVDNLGRVYDRNKSMTWTYDGYVIYNIDGKYSRLTTTFGMLEERKDSTSQNIVRIYGDDQLIYTSDIMTGGVKPIAIDVDISGFNQLKIEFKNSNSLSTNAALFDIALYP